MSTTHRDIAEPGYGSADGSGVIYQEDVVRSVWARRLLAKAKTKAEQAKDVVLRKKAAKAEKKAGPEDTSVPLPNDDLA